MVSSILSPWSGEERRAHRRSRPDQPVALLFGRAWRSCEIVDVSQGGVAFRSESRPPLDKEIIVRIAELGLFKCRVLRHAPDGFAARFEAADFGLEDVDYEEAGAASPSDAEDDLYAPARNSGR